MNTPAFVSATPFTARTHALSAVPVSAISAGRNQVVTAAAPKRARLSMTAENEDKSIPQGFTPFSEQLNGRVAMMGFVLAVATEAITGQGIVGQLSSLVKTLELITPFSSFN